MKLFKSTLYLFIFLLLILSSCTQSKNEIVDISCEAFEQNLKSHGFPGYFADYYHQDRPRHKSDCGTYNVRLEDQKLCDEDNSLYPDLLFPDFCNMYVGYYSLSPDICFQNETYVDECIKGFMSNPNNDCSSLEIYNDEDLLNNCQLFKSYKGETKYCNSVTKKYLETCTGPHCETLSKSMKNTCLNGKLSETYNRGWFCGDNKCDILENTRSCPQECASIPKKLQLDNLPVCGDNFCDEEEYCVEKICMGGPEKCVATCPYSCLEDCKSGVTSCVDSTENSDDIYTKDALTTTSKRYAEHCVLVEKTLFEPERKENPTGLEAWIEEVVSTQYKYNYTVVDACQEENCAVYESYCGKYRKHKTKYVACPNGCSDGACLE